MFCISMLSLTGMAQNETTKWYFGINAGLDFMTTPPTILTNGAVNSNEGSTGIADAAGNLLFYTDNFFIYDQTHLPMTPGSTIGGNTASNGAIIIRQPGSATVYYVFTPGGGTGGTSGDFKYSTVDMSLAGGLGAITAADISLWPNSSEKISATPHCNGIDYWIVIHDQDNSDFHAFLLTAAGINPVPVTTSIGPAYAGQVQGQMKISPNGKKLGLAWWSSSLESYQLYNFNNVTGVLSNSLALPSSNSNPYGCEFSPDGTKFYGAGLSVIEQWDLCAGNNAAILASQTTYSASSINTNYHGMQLAPNGKIYVARPFKTDLGVINLPNNLWPAANYVDLGQSVAPQLSTSGLPNFVNSVFYQPPPPPSFFPTPSIACMTATFTPPPVCTGSGFSVTAYAWNFGDPASGAANTSTLSNPVHAYANLGTYTATVVLYYSCGSHSLTLPVVINQPCISITGSVSCAGTGSATVTTAGGTGPYSYTWTPSGQTGSVATGLIPGSYTVMLLDVGTNTTYSQTATLASSNTFTGSVSSTASLNCNAANSGTAGVSLSGGSGSQFYIWYNGIAAHAGPNPVNLSAGNWSLMVTDALTACKFTATFTITEPPALTLTLSANTASACVGHGISFSGAAAGGIPGYSYSWTAGPALNTYTVYEGTPGSYIYTLSVSDANNCIVTNTISGNFINVLQLSVSSVSICLFSAGTLTASGANTYSWSNSTTGNLLTDSPSITTAYSFTGAIFGCTASASASIIVLGLPTVTLPASSAVCNGGSLLLAGNGGTGYQWSGPSGFSPAVQNPVIAPVNQGHAGVYNLTVTAANGCQATGFTTVLVHPTPTLNVAGSSICTTQVFSLSASSVPGAAYFWTGPLSFTSNIQSPVGANTTTGQTGAYTLTATSPQGCTNTAIASVSVSAPPSLTLSLSSNSFCAQALNGSPNTITLTSGGASSYTLSVPDHFSNPYPGGPSSSISLLPPFVPTGPATATLIGSNGICTLSTTAVFSVIPNPVVSPGNYTPVICSGQSYTYTASGANSFTWSSVTPGSTLYTTGNVAVANPGVNSVFSVMGGSLGCNSATQSSTLTVNPLPTLSVNPQPALLCLGSSAQLIASGTGTAYTWLPASWLNVDNSATVTSNPPALQNYVVVSSLNNCTTSAAVTVSVLPLPVAGITAPKTSLCAGDSVVLEGSGGISCSWKGPLNFNAAGQLITFNAISASYSGIYTLTVSDHNNCKASATKSITVYGLPQGYFNTASLRGCVPFCASLDFKTGISSAALSNMSWQVNNQAYAGSSFTSCFNRPGNYLIQGALSDINGCSNSYTGMVQVYPRPEAGFSFQPGHPVENLDAVQFSDGSSGATSFSWYFGSTAGSSSGKNPTWLYETAGTYVVAQVVSNEWGCSDTAIKTLLVMPDVAVYVPNAFTPNEDGRNELFGPVLRGAAAYTMMVFDRWGEKIFETSDIAGAWDGTFKGEACQQGVYVWKLHIEFENATPEGKQKRDLSGSVLLYR